MYEKYHCFIYDAIYEIWTNLLVFKFSELMDILFGNASKLKFMHICIIQKICINVHALKKSKMDNNLTTDTEAHQIPFPFLDNNQYISTIHIQKVKCKLIFRIQQNFNLDIIYDHKFDDVQNRCSGSGVMIKKWTMAQMLVSVWIWATSVSFYGEHMVKNSIFKGRWKASLNISGSIEPIVVIKSCWYWFR